MEEFQKLERENSNRYGIWSWILPTILAMGTTLAVVAAATYLKQIGWNEPIVGGLGATIGITGYALSAASSYWVVTEAFEWDKERIFARVAIIVQNKFASASEA